MSRNREICLYQFIEKLSSFTSLKMIFERELIKLFLILKDGITRFIMKTLHLFTFFGNISIDNILSIMCLLQSMDWLSQGIKPYLKYIGPTKWVFGSKAQVTVNAIAINISKRSMNTMELVRILHATSIS